jgi:hypothetical protein
MIALDGKEVKVGDRLWSFVYGWGTVSSYDSLHADLLIRVVFDGYKNSGYFYNLSGVFNGASQERTLFWDEITFDIPVPPKPKVKKYLLVLRNRFNLGWYCVSSTYYAGVPEYPNDIAWEAVQIIEDSMIEVEDLNGS